MPFSFGALMVLLLIVLLFEPLMFTPMSVPASIVLPWNVLLDEL